MADQPRDWDKEMAEIDKLIAKQPAAPRAASIPSERSAAPPPLPGRPSPDVPVRPARKRERAATWVWVVLAGALTALLLLWPRANDCGLGLLYYLAVIAALFITGLFGARAAWRRHQGLAHTLSLLAIGGSIVLAAQEILPRTGYAREAARWTCPVTSSEPQTPSSGAAMPAGAEPAGTQPAGTQPAGTQPAGDQPAGTQQQQQPAGTQPAENQPAATTPQ